MEPVLIVTGCFTAAIALSAGINIVATILAVSFSFRAFSLPGLAVYAANEMLAVHGLLWLCILIGAAFGAG